MYYGPDTYMGRNLAVMLRAVSQLSDGEIAALHPAHNRASVQVQLSYGLKSLVCGQALPVRQAQNSCKQWDCILGVGCNALLWICTLSDSPLCWSYCKLRKLLSWAYC